MINLSKLYIYRVVGNWWYKRKGDDSTRKKGSKIYYKNFTIDVRAFCRYTSLYNYTGWLVTGGTSEKGVILREKISRKYRIKIFRLRLCFRENRH